MHQVHFTITTILKLKVFRIAPLLVSFPPGVYFVTNGPAKSVSKLSNVSDPSTLWGEWPSGSAGFR